MDKTKKPLHEMDTTKKSRIPMDTAKKSCIPMDMTKKSHIPMNTTTKSCIPMNTTKKSPIPKRHVINVDKKPKLSMRMEDLMKFRACLFKAQQEKLAQGYTGESVIRRPKFNQLLPLKAKPLHHMDITKKLCTPTRQFINVDNKQKLSVPMEDLRKVRACPYTPQGEKVIQGYLKDSDIRCPKFNQSLPLEMEPLHKMDTTQKSLILKNQFINVDKKQKPRMGVEDLRKVRAYLLCPQQGKLARSCYAGDSNAEPPHQMDTTEKSRVPTSQFVNVDKKRKLRTGGKPSSQFLSGILQEKRTSKRTCTRPPHPNDRFKIPFHEYDSRKVLPPYPYNIGKLPPHPHESGKVSQVNICPECEAYTVKELERHGTSYPREEALRARYMCGLCRKNLDLGITMFDPRGWPGVTLYKGADLFQPPVPPTGTPPCPRCLENARVSFQCMTLYLREESRVPCQPACPAPRLHCEEELEREEEEECQTSFEIGRAKMSVQSTLDGRHTIHKSSGVRLPTPLTVDTERELMKRLVWTVIGRDYTKLD